MSRNDDPPLLAWVSGQRKPGKANSPFTETLRSCRRSADNLMLVAAEAERRLLDQSKRIKADWEQQAKSTSNRVLQKLQPLSGAAMAGEDWPNSLPAAQRTTSKRWEPRPLGGGSKLRKIRSASDLRRLSPDEGGEWDLLAALNNTFSANRAATAGSPYMAPSFQDQARLVMASDAARRLMAAPKRTMRTAKQALENCQENLQTLGSLLQQTVATNLPAAVSRPDLPGHAPAPEPVKPLGSHNTGFTTRRDAVAPVRTHPMEALAVEDFLALEASLGALDAPGVEGTAAAAAAQGPDALKKWFAGFLRAREIAEIDRALREGGDSPTAEEVCGGRQLGPLQQEALRRRQAQRRRKRSSLREPGRRVAIYTTAALPWMTGTAVNPLLRAAYLAKEKHREVTLVIPWLAPPDQALVYNGRSFETPAQQEAYVREWARARTGLPCDFKVAFYPGRYAVEKCSILPVGDPTAYIPDHEADVAILEEPEHLNWYHHGRRWTDKFAHVVGIIHTNYLDYAQREDGGQLKAKALGLANQAICRMHCHKVVKLSDAVQELPRSVTEFVHGVPESFLAVGQAKAAPPPEGGPRFGKGAYFIGKAIWAKGYTELLNLMERDARSQPDTTHVDCFGYGDDLDELKATAAKKALPVQFHGARDHLDSSMHDYQVFVNPSTSDVVATTTAEALAMGKWVVVADLPCNAFFRTFSNCLTYRTPEEFSARLRAALATEPAPMSGEERRRLTWEAATERFLDVAELTGAERPKPLEEAVDRIAWNAFNAMSGVEPLRAVTGAGVNTKDNPISLESFAPSPSPGGIFDSKARERAAAAQRAV